MFDFPIEPVSLGRVHFGVVVTCVDEIWLIFIVVTITSDKKREKKNKKKERKQRIMLSHH